MRCTRFAASAISIASTRRSAPLTMRSSVCSARISQRPLARALAMKVTSAEPLSRRGQPWVQPPQ